MKALYSTSYTRNLQRVLYSSEIIAIICEYTDILLDLISQPFVGVVVFMSGAQVSTEECVSLTLEDDTTVEDTDSILLRLLSNMENERIILNPSETQVIIQDNDCKYH